MPNVAFTSADDTIEFLPVPPTNVSLTDVPLWLYYAGTDIRSHLPKSSRKTWEQRFYTTIADVDMDTLLLKDRPFMASILHELVETAHGLPGGPEYINIARSAYMVDSQVAWKSFVKAGDALAKIARTEVSIATQKQTAESTLTPAQLLTRELYISVTYARYTSITAVLYMAETLASGLVYWPELRLFVNAHVGLSRAKEVARLLEIEKHASELANPVFILADPMFTIATLNTVARAARIQQWIALSELLINVLKA